MLLREKSILDWALILFSSAIEDPHGMDTAFYNHQKVQNFLTIVKNRVGLGLVFFIIVGFGLLFCLVGFGFAFVLFGFVFYMEKGLYSYKPRRRGVIHTR